MFSEFSLEKLSSLCGSGSLLYICSNKLYQRKKLLYNFTSVDLIFFDKNDNEKYFYLTKRIIEDKFNNEIKYCNYLFCDELISDFSHEQIDLFFKNCFNILSNYLVLNVSIIEVDGFIRNRDWWEKRCFDAGFRIHARSFHFSPYAERENDSSQIVIILEKIPSQALSSYPLNLLNENRLLHMDMLRESGRRGDAHCVRYHMAAEYIRPGDMVLDVACGLGYGTYILYQNSLADAVLGIDSSEFGIEYAQANYGIADKVKYRFGDAQNLNFLPDNSVDFITSFETIEHLPNPSVYLEELNRVLRPSGRLMISAPNDWTDESGIDPNPHHFHVYTWARLKDECKKHFLLEKGFVQTAGGAMKCHHAPRMWNEVPLNAELSIEAEWVLLLCMSDPLTGHHVPYTEKTWKFPELPDFNITAFARDYLNPWLVKGMISIGMRSLSAENLNSMQQRVLCSLPPDSADYGAALCGRAYATLGENSPKEESITELVDAIKLYASILAPTPHQLRWQVSLLYVGGELARINGDINEARTLYSHCASLDVMSYSPLLGNKTLEALYMLSLLALRDEDYVAAREYLIKSVKEAQRLVSGSWLNVCGEIEHPLTFGFPELAQLMDKASRAAYMLYALDSHKTRQGQFCCEAKGYYERVLYDKNIENVVLKNNVEILSKELNYLKSFPVFSLLKKIKKYLSRLYE